MGKKSGRGEFFLSRKFLLALISLMLITLLSYLSVDSPSVQGVLPTFIGGILGVLGLYYTGNVSNKFVVGRATNISEQQTLVAGNVKGQQDHVAEQAKADAENEAS